VQPDVAKTAAPGTALFGKRSSWIQRETLEGSVGTVGGAELE
jgi:hypothetical protein